MAGTVIADRLEAASTSQLVIENGVALTPPTISDVNGVQIGTFCRAWVNFNGTGTVAIRASFNVSSITDNGTGDYTLNFTTAMPDGNYSVATTGSGINANLSYYVVGIRNQNPPDIKSTTALRMQCGNGANGAAADSAEMNVTIFR